MTEEMINICKEEIEKEMIELSGIKRNWTRLYDGWWKKEQ